MDMSMLRDVEEKSKILKSEMAQLYEEALEFCRTSNDPEAQDIKHRLDVIATGREALSPDIDKLQLMYDTSRHSRVDRPNSKPKDERRPDKPKRSARETMRKWEKSEREREAYENTFYYNEWDRPDYASDSS